MAAQTTERNEQLAPLIGEWSMTMIMPGGEKAADIGAQVTFEWMGDKAFLLERWTVPIPEAPDGLALIGWDDGRGMFLQHYFDERGVARVYEMGFDGRVWTLERTKPDFSAFNFSQRFTGTFSDDANTITGRGQLSQDGSTWEDDLALNYQRVA